MPKRIVVIGFSGVGKTKLIEAFYYEAIGGHPFREIPTLEGINLERFNPTISKWHPYLHSKGNYTDPIQTQQAIVHRIRVNKETDFEIADHPGNEFKENNFSDRILNPSDGYIFVLQANNNQDQVEYYNTIIERLLRITDKNKPLAIVVTKTDQLHSYGHVTWHDIYNSNAFFAGSAQNNSINIKSIEKSFLNHRYFLVSAKGVDRIDTNNKVKDIWYPQQCIAPFLWCIQQLDNNQLFYTENQLANFQTIRFAYSSSKKDTNND